jgi:DNA-binding transcriptional regulator YiaG
MTPDEFKEARISLGLSQSKMAAVLGVSKRTLEYWEADDGKRPVHPTAIKAMTWLLSGYRPKGWPTA